MDYQIEFTDKEITPWAGILMLKKMLDRMDLDSCLDTLNLPEQRSNRGYSSCQLVVDILKPLFYNALITDDYEHVLTSTTTPLTVSVLPDGLLVNTASKRLVQKCPTEFD